MKQTFALALVALALFGIAPRAQAQATLGLRGGYDLEYEAALVGGEIRYAIPSNTHIEINPAVDYFFVEDADNVDQTALQVDINALYNFGVQNVAFTPYAGAGLGLTYNKVSAGNRESSDWDPGLNLIGGARFGMGGLQPFVQARIKVAGDADIFSLQGGILFRLGQ